MAAYSTELTFLLTNDDGIMAPGLWAAARALHPLGNVVVVAPDVNQSGRGTSLPPQRRLEVFSYPDVPDDLAGVSAHALSATPATCVQVGLSGALTRRPIHLVVSGVNDAHNLGRDVIYSGTVGAALTAHLRGVPALAASFGDGSGPDAHWETATWAVQDVVRSMLDAVGGSPALLNLNIPNRPLADVAGVELTALSTQTLLDRYTITLETDNMLRLHSTPELLAAPEPNSDAWAVARGYLSITPLQLFPDILCVAPWHGSLPTSYPRVYPDGVWSAIADAR
jgi:5'-nucleotidase